MICIQTFSISRRWTADPADELVIKMNEVTITNSMLCYSLNSRSFLFAFFVVILIQLDHTIFYILQQFKNLANQYKAKIFCYNNVHICLQEETSTTIHFSLSWLHFFNLDWTLNETKYTAPHIIFSIHVEI